MELAFFYIFAAISVISAILVISFRNTLSSALALIMTLFGLACIYALLEAHFLAVMQVLIYAGAVMVLFVFVIMLMNLGREELLKIRMSFSGVVGILVGGYLATIFVLRLSPLAIPLPPSGGDTASAGGGYGSVGDVGRLLFTDYMIAFEITSFLLLVAILGVVVMARTPSPAETTKTTEPLSRNGRGINLPLSTSGRGKMGLGEENGG